MICDDIIYLVAESPDAHGIFEAHNETQRMVFAQVRSVSAWEYWRAKDNGLNPTYIFRLSDAVDYNGEKICIYNGERYRITRTNNVIVNNDKAGETDGRAIDLTVERATVDSTFTEVNNAGNT